MHQAMTALMPGNAVSTNEKISLAFQMRFRG
jgi:hypothetical protein